MEDSNQTLDDIRYELKTILGLVIFNMMLFVSCFIFLAILLYSKLS
jgi:hypothetical protein